MRFIHGMLSIDIHAESDIDSVPSSKCFYNGLSCSVFITSDDDDQNEINETEEVEGPEAEPWILENGINITNLFTEYRQRVEQFVKSEGFIPLESHVQELAALNHILIPKPLQYSKMMKEVFTDKHIKHILNEQVRMSIDLSFDFTSEELMQLNLILKHLINQAQSVCKITTDLLLFSSSLNYEKRRAIIDIVLL
ncbi:hypothetical protein G6F44_012313 [Rhizopus delemar]|nr:hypothetical protein G6F44_012313 [Rhizopus delemar]